MIDEIFNEIFGNGFFNEFEESSKKLFEELEKNEENEEEKGSSYYHKIADRYEGGKHVSHIEKEVKDGKVIKDIHNTCKIEDKSDVKENKEDQLKIKGGGVEDMIQFYTDKTQMQEKKIETLCKKIDEKNEKIDELIERCTILERENNRIKSSLRELIQPQKK